MSQTVSRILDSTCTSAWQVGCNRFDSYFHYHTLQIMNPHVTVYFYCANYLRMITLDVK